MTCIIGTILLKSMNYGSENITVIGPVFVKGQFVLLTMVIKTVKCCLALYVLYLTWTYWDVHRRIVSQLQNLEEKYSVESLLPLESNGDDHSWMDTNDFILNSENCQIPAVFPFHPSVKDTIKFKPPISCSVNFPMLTYIEKFVYVTVNRSAALYYGGVKHCKYYQVFRPSSTNDNLFKISVKGIRFNSTALVSFDFIMVKCFSLTGQIIYKHYHALIQQKYHSQKDVSQPESASATTKPNILMIGIDSVSRLNFLRFMPETRKVLLHGMKAFDLKGFNKVAANTLVNILPMLTGSFMQELTLNSGNWPADHKFDDVPLIWNDLNKRGYTTLFAEDCPRISMFNFAKPGFHQIPVDYYMRPFMLAINEESNMWHTNHKCFMDKTETEIIFNWLLDFQLSHVNTGIPYFALAFLSRLTHDDMNGVAEVDLLYQKFFQTLMDEGLLDNTVLLFFSDHGSRFGSGAHSSLRQFESRLPILFIRPPQNVLTGQQARALKINQNRLTTPFDIYPTLWHLISGMGKRRKHGQSLLNEVPHNRSCHDASIPPYWCACVKQNSHSLNKEDPIAMEAAEFLISYINSLLETLVQNQCAKLKVKSLIDFIYIGENPETVDYHQSQLYRITLKSSPRNVIFAAQIQVNKADNEPFLCEQDYISRISRYYGDAKCIQDESLKRFCHCVDANKT